MHLIFSAVKKRRYVKALTLKTWTKSLWKSVLKQKKVYKIIFKIVKLMFLKKIYRA